MKKFNLKHSIMHACMIMLPTLFTVHTYAASVCPELKIVKQIPLTSVVADDNDGPSGIYYLISDQFAANSKTWKVYYSAYFGNQFNSDVAKREYNNKIIPLLHEPVLRDGYCYYLDSFDKSVVAVEVA